MDNDPTFSMIYPIVLTRLFSVLEMNYGRFFSFQPIIIGVLDQCYHKDFLLNTPELYSEGREVKYYSLFRERKHLLQSKLYTVWLFFINVADGIWQAACVFFICYFTLHNSFMNLWFLGYYLATGMLLVNIGHLALEVRYWVSSSVRLLIDSLPSLLAARCEAKFCGVGVFREISSFFFIILLKVHAM